MIHTETASCLLHMHKIDIIRFVSISVFSLYYSIRKDFLWESGSRGMELNNNIRRIWGFWLSCIHLRVHWRAGGTLWWSG